MKAIEEAKKWLETDYGSCQADITAAEEVIGDLIEELEAHKEVVNTAKILSESDAWDVAGDEWDNLDEALEKLNKGNQ